MEPSALEVAPRENRWRPPNVKAMPSKCTDAVPESSRYLSGLVPWHKLVHGVLGFPRASQVQTTFYITLKLELWCSSACAQQQQVQPESQTSQLQDPLLDPGRFNHNTLYPSS